MTRVCRSGVYALVATICLGAAGCLKRPATTPVRMIEPQLPMPASEAAKAADATPLRLLDTQARGSIGRSLLHKQANSELTEDAVWRWSSPPDRYLDTALRIEVASSPGLRLVDTSHATALAATLTAWDLESGSGSQLVGAVEFQVTGPDGVVHTYAVRSSEPVSTNLPGNLAAASGRLMRRLASEGLARLASER
jgi:hypothetical protein